MSSRLAGKLVFVTGATAGIGEACAECFAEAGARLILCARREERLGALAERLRQAHGVEVHPVALDVRDQPAVAAAVAGLPEEWSGIDVLVNNAGLSRGLAPLHEGELRDWEEMIDTNVKGLLYVSRAVLPGMVERGAGHVINVGSIAGREVYPGGNVYCATKFAVDALTRSLRVDLNPHGVKVSAVDPGAVRTEFSLVRFHGDAEKAEKPYAGITPLAGRDVAEVVLFVAGRPAHVNVAETLILPLDQASTTVFRRR